MNIAVDATDSKVCRATSAVAGAFDSRAMPQMAELEIISTVSVGRLPRFAAVVKSGVTLLKSRIGERARDAHVEKSEAVAAHRRGADQRHVAAGDQDTGGMAPRLTLAGRERRDAHQCEKCGRNECDDI